MKRTPSIVMVLLLSLASAKCLAGDLAGDIDRVLNDKLLSHAHVGIDIARLGKTRADMEVLYQSDPTMPLIPASNLKVITNSAALEELGPQFRFCTMLLLHGQDLVLIGDGDPTLGDVEMLKKVGWDVDTVFKKWADGLSKRGINSAHDLLVDDSVFDDQFLNPDWPADQTQKRYVAEIAGLNLNANCLDIYVRPGGYGQIVSFTTNPITRYFSIENSCVTGHDNAVWVSREPNSNAIILRGQANTSNDVPVWVTVHDPAMYAGTVLAETLQSAGIKFSGSIKRDRTLREAALKAVASKDPNWILLAYHETPLASVIDRANKDSMNLYAECVCKRLGYAESGQGSWATGTAAVAHFLSELKVSPSEYRLDDGCGLSKQNAISSHLMLTVLAHDFYGPNAKDWLSSLAVAGQDGTLMERFRGSDLRGRVIAKTGFVNGVSCLSGYLFAKDQNWYVFSILFNGIPPGTNSGAKELQERIVRALDQHMRPVPVARSN